LDGAAFDPPVAIRHGSQQSEAGSENGRLGIRTAGPDNQSQWFFPERVLGVDPLRQFLIPFERGRVQVTELAYDPGRSNWFDVYGEEDRRPGEWGHWTGRGMTWNSMCAGCHNTRVRKGYSEATDTYDTRMAEMGVGCEACHGPMADHNAWQAVHPNREGDPTIRRLSREQMFAVCGSCHARRAELTGDFAPGEAFQNHFALSIPDETDLFYPDGQIRDEDFELTAFMGSKMHAAGVRCLDCHEPHGAKVRIPGNNLCMVCHAAPAPPAPKIDLATHSHHKPGEKGDNCVDCHMPQTVYMQRHSRHDHGFTIPDPLLTKELGIPNACTRCHADKGLDWNIEAVEKWYGARMNRPTRDRARILARAHGVEPSPPEPVLALLKTETNGFWRAVAAGFLRRWANDPKVVAALVAGSHDPDSRVRAVSVRALDHAGNPPGPAIEPALKERLEDSSRQVRVDAAWALHATLDTNSLAGRELLHFLDVVGDQPGGALQRGVWELDRGDLPSAMACFRRALTWDTNSAPLHNALAVGLSMEGQSQAAVEALQTACRLAPREAEYAFKLGLALNEVGKVPEACEALTRATRLDPQFARAWYNLGLAQHALGQAEAALESLSRAESLDQDSPQPPYARATILAQLGRTAEARNAARRALELQPTHAEAAALLRSLGQ
jgi:predicted CXXCH cytochrome family protein